MGRKKKTKTDYPPGKWFYMPSNMINSEPFKKLSPNEEEAV
jgi:hypothetical protein